MIDRKYFFFVAALILVIPLGTVTAEDAKTCKCPVTGEPVVVGKAEASAEYKRATVYLCCNDCKVKFDADRKKYSTKSNMQLVATGQAKQVKCPFSGQPVNAAQSIAVDKLKISFCCADCKGKASEATGDEQMAMIFGDQAFAKGFEIGKKKD